jgi:hypothetical protein
LECLVSAIPCFVLFVWGSYWKQQSLIIMSQLRQSRNDHHSQTEQTLQKPEV